MTIMPVCYLLLSLLMNPVEGQCKWVAEQLEEDVETCYGVVTPEWVLDLTLQCGNFSSGQDDATLPLPGLPPPAGN
jgi:hypothetical protein